MKKHIATTYKKAPCIAVLETSPNSPFINAIADKLMDYGIPHYRIMKITLSKYATDTKQYTLPSGKTCTLTTLPPTECRRFEFEANWFEALISKGIPILTICGSTQHLAHQNGYTMRYKVHHVSKIKHNPRHPLSTASVPMSPEQVFRLLQDASSHHYIVVTNPHSLSYQLAGAHIALPSFHNHAVSDQKTLPSIGDPYKCYLEPVAYDIEQTHGQTPIIEILENKTQCPVILALQGHPEATQEEPFFAGFVSAAHLYSFELSNNIIRRPEKKRPLREATQVENAQQRIHKVLSGAAVLHKKHRPTPSNTEGPTAMLPNTKHLHIHPCATAENKL